MSDFQNSGGKETKWQNLDLQLWEIIQDIKSGQGENWKQYHLVGIRFKLNNNGLPLKH